ncbi:FtsX-like permease family protein [Dactylosporangium sucinum]|uniref:Membrane protein n=1 Tax=Dactylosporangium sucinum TaxID=1424081 RepID=A0A917TNR2_9ACTN|nr:FtsX-like permease family protein [Dactylosporangium sucinum]GGM30655.1 membrane protein [Dactylosporangium sucinum]
MTRWFADVALGARLALGGGREGLLRTGLTAVGVALGVAVLLLSVSVPAMLGARAARTDARDDLPWGSEAPARTEHTVLSLPADDSFRGRALRVRYVLPEGADPVLPPGVKAFPPAGSMLVSPALKRLLESPDGALLRQRYPAPIAGTIGEPGLAGPRELALYQVRTDLREEQSRVLRLGSYGSHSPSDGLNPFLLLLVVVIFVVLLMPVAMFVAAATRFGGEQRDRRLAAVRLAGADSGMARRIAAGEAVVSAAGGVLLGAVFFLLGRQLIERFEVARLSVFATDVRPSPGLALLIVVAVPLAALAMTLLAMRRVVVEPLGVVRRATARTKPRLWWRVLLPVGGLALLYPLIGTRGAEFNPWQAVGGVVLLLLGVATLLPWMFDRLVGPLAGAGTLAWQLAVRRLQLSGGSSVRAVNAIAVAAAGTIALQMLFSAAQAEYTKPTGQDLSRAQAMTVVADSQLGPVRDAADVDARLRAARGVTGVSTYRRGVATTATKDVNGDPAIVEALVADCAVLRELATLPSCADGDTFALTPGLAGQTVEINDRPFLVPASTRAVTARPDPWGDRHVGLLFTPSAAPPVPPEATYVSFARLDPADPDASEHLRTAAAAISPTMDVSLLTQQETDTTFAGIRRGLYAGATVTLLLVGLSLLVGTLEQLRERRRTLAALVAFGTRRTTLGWSILWQTAVPVALGLLLATALGLSLGTVLLRIVAVPVRPDWTSVGSVAAISAGVVLLVTTASLPALWRLMRPDGLRFE